MLILPEGILEYFELTNVTQTEPEKAEPKSDRAIFKPILYKEEGEFTPCGNYIFEAVGEDNLPLSEGVSIDDVKCAIDFYFTSILGTDLHVKNIQVEFGLCPQKRKSFSV